MQSRMDKYSTNETPVRSRIQKNKGLYEDVKKSDLTDFDVNSNVSVIETNANSIDVRKLSRMLDERYNADAPKIKTIEVPEGKLFDYEEPLYDTKEYDINAILQQKKQGKKVDYNKQRLQTARNAQYEILKDLDLELKKVEESKMANKKKADEENLMSLINTITQLELKNKEEEKMKEASQSLSLLNDLSDEEEIVDEDDRTLPQSEIPENYTREMKKEKEIEPKEEIKEKTSAVEVPKIEEKERDNHIEETLSKLDIKLSGYEDFSDISKRDNSAIVIKVVIFIIIIALVVGAAFILNNVLDLGLF